jgi:hypothetical protein
MITDLCGILTLTLPNNYKPCCGNFIWTGHTVHNSMHKPWSAHVLVFRTKTFSCNSEDNVHERERDRETDKQSMNWSKISSLHKTVVSCPDMYQQKATVYYLRMISLWLQKSRVDLRTHYNQNKTSLHNKRIQPSPLSFPSPRSSPLSLSPVPPPKKDKSFTALSRQN